MPRAIITKKTPSPTMTQTPGGVFTLRSLSPDRVLEVALFQSRLAMRPPHFTRFRSVLQMQFQFRAPTSPYLFPKHIRYLCDRNPVLLHRVAIADGDGILIGRPVLADRIKVHRYAERCPRFVLSSIAPADRAGFVIEHHHFPAQGIGNVSRLPNESLVVFQERENPALDWRHSGVKPQHGA